VEAETPGWRFDGSTPHAVTDGEIVRMKRADVGLTHRALRSMAWTAAGTAVELPLQLIVIMALARLLTPADFGVVAMAHVVTSLLGIVGELGLGSALIQRDKLEPTHVRTAVTACLAFGLVTGTGLWVLSPVVARVFVTPMVEPMTRTLALALVIKAWGTVPSALLQRALRFRELALANVLSYVVGFGFVGIGMAVAGFGAWALVGAYIVQVSIQSLVAHIAQPLPQRWGVDARALREMLSYGGGTTLAELLNFVALRGDNMVVGYRLGALALGLYGPAYQLMALPAELFQRVVQNVLFPAVSRVQTEPARLTGAFRRALAVTGLVVLPGTALAILLAPDLVNAILGPRWSGVIAPLQILAAGMFFRVGYKTSVVFVRVAGATHSFALRQLPYPIMVLSFSWLGSPWGIEGVAVGVVVALGVHYLLLTALGLRVARLTLRDYFVSHRPAVLLASALFVQAWLALAAAHGLGTAAWGSLTVVGLSTCVTAAALIRWLPTHALGAEGLWFHQSLVTFSRDAWSALASRRPDVDERPARRPERRS
jgi:O-antigen/teichoic acid export membrane protein